jgi:hypothetical protein
MPNHQDTVICLTTHNRIDCARINQEIIKQNYVDPLPIVHACSSPDYDRYLEDVFVKCQMLPLKDGALNLIQQSISAAIAAYDPTYIVHLEGDTWILDERVIHRYIRKMDANEDCWLCTCSWDDDDDRPVVPAAWNARQILARTASFFDVDRALRGVGSLGTQFFIVKNRKDIIDLIMALKPVQGESLERTFFRMFVSSYRGRNVLRMRDREPVHPAKRYQCEDLSLFCQHWPACGTAEDPRPATHPLYVQRKMIGKKEVLERHEGIRTGPYIRKLLESRTFDYYNPGAKRY